MYCTLYSNHCIRYLIVLSKCLYPVFVRNRYSFRSGIYWCPVTVAAECSMGIHRIASPNSELVKWGKRVPMAKCRHFVELPWCCEVWLCTCAVGWSDFWRKKKIWAHVMLYSSRLLGDPKSKILLWSVAFSFGARLHKASENP